MHFDTPKAFKSQTASRDYRGEFSKAYKILYKEGSLCYLTEILDSAQEGMRKPFYILPLINMCIAFPYLWVNGEKYIFSSEVIESGKQLFSSFRNMQYVIRNLYTRACQENAVNTVYQIRTDMCSCLEEFDLHWVTFEQVQFYIKMDFISFVQLQLYVMELMLIEGDARRFISDAIETEKELKSIEIREKARGKIVLDIPEYHVQRVKLAKQIAQLNSVANSEGKGRDDLTIDILLNAEGIMRRISPDQSRAVRALAERIRNSFSAIRQLLCKYEQNIEVVDPQLKNNPDLVEALKQYESAWEKGKAWFVNGKKCTQLLHFSQIIEATSEKYQDFAEQIEYREADIFVTIPALLMLRSLENNDKGICRHYLPNLGDEKDKLGAKYKELETLYHKNEPEAGRKRYEYYNYIERLTLNLSVNTEMEFTSEVKKEIGVIINLIKNLSIELQRANPSEWNSFLDVVLDGGS